ncbi:MAG: FtsW/RodA/SpoVE family cell cycle protein, partial [Gammaproteobacteria bacterium]|nr:FtsW/RodA/SpoVE family cell cycle protein [Gammaproteobacteria bacterium]
MSGQALRMRQAATRLQRLEPVLPVNGLLLVTALLLVIGLMMMTSASVEIASSQYGDPLFHFKRQAVFTVLGVVVLLFTVCVPTQKWRAASGFLLLMAYGLLVLVLVPGVGRVVNGSARWLDLGFFNLQPSELAKVFMVMYLAAFLERHRDEVREQWTGFIKPLLVAGVAIVLLYFEPDHGAIVILLTTAFSMVFLAGAKLHLLMLVLGSCVSGFFMLAVKYPHVIERFTSFLNPWAEEYVYGSGYQ